MLADGKLLIPDVDAPDILVILEPQFVLSSLQISDLSGGRLLKLLKLESNSIAFCV
jgi:hypothetical protein